MSLKSVPSSTQLQAAHSASTQLSATPSTLLEPKLGNFPKFRPKNWELSILIKNWHARYLEGAEILDFWNSDPKISFRAKFGRKSSFCLKIDTHTHTHTDTHSNSMVLILFLILVFEDAVSYSEIGFLKFQS